MVFIFVRLQSKNASKFESEVIKLTPYLEHTRRKMFPVDVLILSREFFSNFRQLLALERDVFWRLRQVYASKESRSSISEEYVTQKENENGHKNRR